MCTLQIFKIPPPPDVVTSSPNAPMKAITEGKGCITKHLGKMLTRHSRQIICDILAVDCGAKPSFLFDYGCVKPKQVLTLMQDLQQRALLLTSPQPSSFLILSLEGDVLLCNVATLHSHLLQTTRGESTMFIDISKNNLKAKLLENLDQLNGNIVDVLQQIISCCHDCKDTNEIEFPVSLNLTTLVGVLLGYPVVYWFNRSDEADGNSLLIDTLTVFKLISHLLCQQCHLHQDKNTEKPVSQHEQNSFPTPISSAKCPHICDKNPKPSPTSASNGLLKHTIYSFSVPVALTSQVLTCVESWLQNIKHTCAWKETYQHLYLEQNLVHAPAESYSISF